MCAIQLVHGELCRDIVGVFYEVYRELGAGFLESAYQRAMQIALKDAGIPSDREVPTTVYFRGQSIGDYKMDLVAQSAVILECKTADRIAIPHKVQLRNYLKSTNYTLGIILNFGPTPTFKRVVYESARKR